MRNLKEMLQEMSDRRVATLANKIWEAYNDNGEDGIGFAIGVDRKEAARMLECTDSDIDTVEDLAECLMVYRDGCTEEALLKSELRKIRAREAQIKARLKELQGSAA